MYSFLDVMSAAVFASVRMMNLLLISCTRRSTGLSGEPLGYKQRHGLLEEQQMVLKALVLSIQRKAAAR